MDTRTPDADRAGNPVRRGLRHVNAGRRHLGPRATSILTLLATLAGAGALVLDATSASADSGLQVYVGYMDTHGGTVPSANSPNPWPNTDPSSFIGTPCPQWPTSSAYNICWDAAAIRLVNTTSSPVTVDDVNVVVSNGTVTNTYDLWGSFTVQANGQMILTETGSQNSGDFDLSDEPPNDYNGGNTAPCVNSGAIPVVNVTVGGVTTGYTDTGQVLNTGGVDLRHCVNGTFVSQAGNESEPWAQVFAGSSPSPSSTATSVVQNGTSAGSSAYDTATVTGSGGATPTGTVAYTFFANGTCAGSGAAAGTVTLTGTGTVPNSNTESSLAAGSYSFDAAYSGDANYAGSTGKCEPFTVSQGTSFAFGGNLGFAEGKLTSASVTVPAGGVPAGSLVVVGIASYTAAESFTVTDSAGNTYSLDNSRTLSSPYGYQFHSLTSAPLPQGATISVQWGGASIDAVIEGIWFSTSYKTVSTDLAVSGHSSGTALSTGNKKTTAHANELVIGMGGPRMPGTATYNDDTADGFTQALFTGDTKQSNDLSYKVVSAVGVFDYKPTISVSSSWVDLLTTYFGS